jgi:hypothetical protein
MVQLRRSNCQVSFLDDVVVDCVHLCALVVNFMFFAFVCCVCMCVLCVCVGECACVRECENVPLTVSSNISSNISSN